MQTEKLIEGNGGTVATRESCGRVTVTNYCPRTLQFVRTEGFDEDGERGSSPGLVPGEAVTLELVAGAYRFEVGDDRGWLLLSPVIRVEDGQQTDWLVR